MVRRSGGIVNHRTPNFGSDLPPPPKRLEHNGCEKNRKDQENKFEQTCRSSGSETKQEEHRYEDKGDAISDRAGLTRRWPTARGPRAQSGV
jgi:hypothetical protein